MNNLYQQQSGDHNSERGKRRKWGMFFLGLALGVVIGIVGAFVVGWYVSKIPLPFIGRLNEMDTQLGVDAGTNKLPRPLPGKSGDPPIEKPRFDFYRILPSDGTPKPSPAVSDKAVSPTRTNSASAQSSSTLPAAIPNPSRDGKIPTPAATANTTAQANAAIYFLQVGAFQGSTEADSMKARVALLGFDAQIQQALSQERGILYRVRVGPFANIEGMNRARNQLSESNIQGSVVKITSTN